MTDNQITIPCPDCAANGRGHVLLAIRTNRATGHEFLGCPEWPKCNYTQEVPESLKMIRAGQPMLFPTEEQEAQS